MTEDLQIPPASPPKRRRQRRDPNPRFKQDRSAEVDPLRGAPEYQVPEDHLARRVRDWVAPLDLSAVEARYSSLGRRGYAPRNVLGVWIYASLRGIHHASEVAELMKTDAAYRLLSGGYTYSATVLRTFRRENKTLFQALCQQVVEMAWSRGLLDPEQCNVDSMRLHAHASNASLRTLSRSHKRLNELSAVDPDTLPDDDARAAHHDKLTKHQQAVLHCQDAGKTSYSTTTPSAALMKFPSGASGLGHRVTAVACRSDLRLIVQILIHDCANDYGLLEPAARAARNALLQAGMPDTTRIQMAGDPGYFSEADLVFAQKNAGWIDILLKEPPPPKKKEQEGLFTREDFEEKDGVMYCPAGVAMKRTELRKDGREVWDGVGCASCPLKAQCTKAAKRSLTRSPAREVAVAAMRDRMSHDGAKARYNQRIATVEPVFGYLQDTMGFRRSTSRFTESIQAEIHLKVLAYNLSRLASGKPLISFFVLLGIEEDQPAILDAWFPDADGSTCSMVPYFC